MNMFDLRGKNALVTGGTRGLGAAAAQGLMESGCSVVIIGSTERVYDLAEHHRSCGYRCFGLKADLGMRQRLNSAFYEGLDLLDGKLDILVNAAGIQRRYPPEEFPGDVWDEVIQINLTATFLLSQLAGQVMLGKRNGKIINFGSLISYFGGHHIAAYAASKGGVAQLTKALSNDWAGKGVCVNCIIPGYMDTDMNRALIQDERRYQSITERIPIGRWGTPDDVKGAVIFLASSASDYITGAMIPVDGGYLAK